MVGINKLETENISNLRWLSGLHLVPPPKLKLTPIMEGRDLPLDRGTAPRQDKLR